MMIRNNVELINSIKISFEYDDSTKNYSQTFGEGDLVSVTYIDSKGTLCGPIQGLIDKISYSAVRTPFPSTSGQTYTIKFDFSKQYGSDERIIDSNSIVELLHYSIDSGSVIDPRIVTPPTVPTVQP